MTVQAQIKEYITSQPEPKRSEIQELHKRISLQTLPGCKLWFMDGKNDKGKAVANPTIGYGSYIIKYADGSTREFFQIGMGASSTGIFVHILAVKGKTYLSDTFGKKLGKASMNGYSVKFKTLKDINLDVLDAAIRYGAEEQKEKAG